MNTNKILKNIVYSLLSQIITIGLGLLIPRLILVGYGSETNGLLNSVTQIIVYLNLFEGGVQLVAIQALYRPVNLDDKTRVNCILSAVNKSNRKTGIIYLCLLLTVAFVYPCIIDDSTLDYTTVFGVVLLSGLGNGVLFYFHGKYRILLQAEGKSYILTNLHTIITVLNNIGKIICITLGYEIVIVVFVSFLISMLQAVYICLLIKRKYSWIDLNSPPDHEAIVQKDAALVHQLAGMVFQNTDVLIITFFCGLKVVSLYSIYKLVISHLGSVLNSLYASFSFALGQKFSTEKSNFIKMIDAVDVYFGGVCFAVYTVAAVLFLPFIKLYTRGVTDIEYADIKLCLLFVVIELLTYARIPMLNTINYAGHFKNTLPQTLIETAINLTVSLTAVHFLGIYGVLLGTVAALVYRDIDVFLYVNHRILKRSAGKTFYIYSVDVCLFCLILLAVNAKQILIGSYIEFITAGLILTLVIAAFYMSILSFFFREERTCLLQVAKNMLSRLR